MRYIFFVLVFVSLSCKHDSPPPTENEKPIENEQESPISIKFGEIAIIKSLDLRVGFRDVNDSRCPEKWECYWQGIAYLRLWLLPTNSDTVFIQPSIEGYVTRIDSTRHWAIDTIGFRIKLLQLDPYPISNAIEKTDYVALIEISKN